MNKTNSKADKRVKSQLRRLDIQFRDKLTLHDGRVIQVVDTLDDIVKGVDGRGATVYVRRFQIKSHYPTNETRHAKDNS